MHASAPVLRAETKGAATGQFAERPEAAAMVVKKQDSYLAEAVAQTKPK